MLKDPRELVKHILDECLFLISATAQVEFSSFIEDETLKRAVARSLEVIGEATKKIPADFKQQHNSIEWKNMAGMRDRLIHDYFGINYAIVWDVLKNKIPELHDRLSKI